MGIINVTPDSFSDGGKYNQLDRALNQVEQMIADGAIIVDIGGESTRPGAELVAVAEEISRVIPLLKAIKARFDVKVSVDTNKAEVMAEALTHGVDLINDVMALQNHGALAVMAQSEVPVCLMHMQGLPQSMQNNPQYQDVVNDIANFFQQRIEACAEAGIRRERLLLDPGFGFGKTLQQNYQLLAHLAQFKRFELPLLVGMSRKTMIGNLLNRDVEQRLAGSLAAALIAAQQGANIIRVHDVRQTVDALKVLQAVVAQQ